MSQNYSALHIAFADVILLNKTDLVPPDELTAVEKRIRALNPQARLHRTERAAVPLDRVLGQGGFDLARILEVEPDFLSGEDDHKHDSEVTSVSFEVARPIDPDRFDAWIMRLLAERGQDLLRTKGILDYSGEHRRFAFQAVHMLADGAFIGPWKAGEPRRSKMVFIGRNLNRSELRRGFEACAADAAPG